MTAALKALHAEAQELITEGRALQAKDNPTDDEKARKAEVASRLNEVRSEIETEKAFDASLSESDKFINAAGARIQSVVSQLQPKAEPTDVEESFAAMRNMRGNPRFFSQVNADKDQARRKAFAFGNWVLALRGNAAARKFCVANNIPMSTTGNMNESVNEDGGFLVPAEFESDLIDLREQFGLFRKYARYTPMASETKSRPRRKSGLTAHFVAGGADGTTSKMGWGRVNLVAKKLMVLAIYESELGEDAIFDLGDTLAGEIAYAFAKKEDQCGFIGDGTSTYGGITGVGNKLLAVDGTIANVQGLVVASGNLFSEFTLADFENVLGRLPDYADTPNTAFYCHRTFYFTVMKRLKDASGGVTAAEITRGDDRGQKTFMGYPVHITQAMPKVDANSQVACYFGDLALSAMFGDRRGTTLAFSEHAEFASDEITVRGTERFDINVHDVGDTTDAGPIIGLISAAS